jgi:predicted dehydrogenase
MLSSNPLVTTALSPNSDAKNVSEKRGLHVAVIGCGYWGPNHIRSFLNIPDCQVTAVDKESGRLNQVSRQFSRIHLESQLEKIWSNPDIDAVVISTPTATHYDFAKQALLAGKHVLCEKPLCTITREAMELTRIAEERKLRLMTGHTFLFNPGINKVKQIIDQDDLGTVLSLSSVRTNLGPIRSDVNAAYDLAAHDVAIFNWLVNAEPQTVSAIGGDFVQSGIHDVVFINLRYPSGQVANIHASWLNPRKVRQMTVVGSRRMATWDDMDLQTPVAIYDRGANTEEQNTTFGEFLRVTTWDGDVRLPKVEATEPLRVQSNYFVKSLTDPSQNRSDGRFSCGVVRTLEAVNTSLKQGGIPIQTT